MKMNLKNSEDIIIEASDVMFAYETDELVELEDITPALVNMSLKIKKGSYTAILGPNGSGKSTFAKLINVLEQPTKGKMVIFGIDSKDEDKFWDIREHCSYVFQNPDNQIVGTVVEEDVAFGPENLGVPNPELRERVDQALSYVGLTDFAKKQAAHLSGGQKQKLAIAGALAMKPEILILDESTAMLDPDSREEFLTIVEKMNREDGLTVVTITHDMAEAARCEEIYVMENGSVTMHGTPSEIFSDPEKIRKASLDVPEFIDVYDNICRNLGKSMNTKDLDSEASVVSAALNVISSADLSLVETEVSSSAKDITGRTILEVENLSYSYEKDGKNQIENISFDVKEGEVLAIVGRSGCGKTTLITHLNGIMRPQTGDVRLKLADGRMLSTSNKKDILELRKNVGLVFQYPEYQLFEETVYNDIVYGLRKEKLSDDEKKALVKEAISKVGFAEEKLESSPFDLSGGQKRRAAIAGVIVMKPKILVLDEPASGLDPKGRHEMFKMIENLRDSGTTIILVSHNMDEAARYADRILAIKDGKAVGLMTPEAMFENEGEVTKKGLKLPRLFEFSRSLKLELSKIYPGILFESMKTTASEEALAILRSVKRYKEAKHA